MSSKYNKPRPITSTTPTGSKRFVMELDIKAGGGDYERHVKKLSNLPGNLVRLFSRNDALGVQYGLVSSPSNGTLVVLTLPKHMEKTTMEKEARRRIALAFDLELMMVCVVVGGVHYGIRFPVLDLKKIYPHLTREELTLTCDDFLCLRDTALNLVMSMSSIRKTSSGSVFGDFLGDEIVSRFSLAPYLSELYSIFGHVPLKVEYGLVEDNKSSTGFTLHAGTVIGSAKFTSGRFDSTETKADTLDCAHRLYEAAFHTGNLPLLLYESAHTMNPESYKVFIKSFQGFLHTGVDYPVIAQDFDISELYLSDVMRVDALLCSLEGFLKKMSKSWEVLDIFVFDKNKYLSDVIAPVATVPEQKFSASLSQRIQMYEKCFAIPAFSETVKPIRPLMSFLKLFIPVSPMRDSIGEVIYSSNLFAHHFTLYKEAFFLDEFKEEGAKISLVRVLAAYCYFLITLIINKILCSANAEAFVIPDLYSGIESPVHKKYQHDIKPTSEMDCSKMIFNLLQSRTILTHALNFLEVFVEGKEIDTYGKPTVEDMKLLALRLSYVVSLYA